jgi:hypothetical protein
MAVDRSLSSNLSDARDAFINATVDVFSAFKLAQNLPSGASGLIAPQNLALFPLYILALLKQVIFCMSCLIGKLLISALFLINRLPLELEQARD